MWDLKDLNCGLTFATHYYSFKGDPSFVEVVASCDEIKPLEKLEKIIHQAANNFNKE